MRKEQETAKYLLSHIVGAGIVGPFGVLNPRASATDTRSLLPCRAIGKGGLSLGQRLLGPGCSCNAAHGAAIDQDDQTNLFHFLLLVACGPTGIARQSKQTQTSARLTSRQPALLSFGDRLFSRTGKLGCWFKLPRSCWK